MLKYNPSSPLSDEELEALPFEEALEYLDSQSEYLKSIALPPSKRDKGIIEIMNERGYLETKRQK